MLQYGCPSAENYAICLTMAALPLPFVVSYRPAQPFRFHRHRRRRRRPCRRCRRLGWTLGNIIEKFYRKLC